MALAAPMLQTQRDLLLRTKASLHHAAHETAEQAWPLGETGFAALLERMGGEIARREG